MYGVNGEEGRGRDRIRDGDGGRDKEESVGVKWEVSMSILDPPSTLIDRDCGRESRIVIRSSSERPTQSDLPLISSEVFNSIASSVDHLPFTSSLLFIPTPLRSPFTFPTFPPSTWPPIFRQPCELCSIPSPKCSGLWSCPCLSCERTTSWYGTIHEATRMVADHHSL